MIIIMKYKILSQRDQRRIITDGIMCGVENMYRAQEKKGKVWERKGENEIQVFYFSLNTAMINPWNVSKWSLFFSLSQLCDLHFLLSY